MQRIYTKNNKLIGKKVLAKALFKRKQVHDDEKFNTLHFI